MNNPINQAKSTCVPTSSNCVRWAGPNLSGLTLCNDSSVTEVIIQLNNQLNTILEAFDISNYDLDCLNLGKCGPKEFKDLTQAILDKLCEINGGETTTDISSIVIDIPECISPGVDQYGNVISQIPLNTYTTIVANKICNILDEISSLNSVIETINKTVEENTANIAILESKKLDKGTLTNCNDEEVDIYDQVQENTDNICQYKSALGTSSELLNSISDCINNTDYDYLFTGTNDSLKNILNQDNTIAATIGNLWILVCDLHNQVGELIKSAKTDISFYFTSRLLCTGSVKYKLYYQTNEDVTITSVVGTYKKLTQNLICNNQSTEKTWDISCFDESANLSVVIYYKDKYNNEKSTTLTSVAQRTITDLAASIVTSGDQFVGVNIKFKRNDNSSTLFLYRGETIIEQFDPDNEYNTYLDSTAEEGKTYTYSIKEENSLCGESVSITTPDPSVSVPSIISVTRSSDSDVTIKNEVDSADYEEWKTKYDNLINE